MTFTNFLEKQPGIKTAQISWYERWVKIYLNLGENKQNFSQMLETCYEEWQIKQANTAIAFYNSWKKIHNPYIDKESINWKKITQQAREQMQLQHLAYRTEKTYLHWLKRFESFCCKENIAVLNETVLQRFLTKLCISCVS